MAAYADPSIRAVLATIGGDDQITVLPHLDPAPFRADPKPFFGYSDNTNLLNWLWTHGVAGYHGGSTMVHLGRGAGMQPVSADSLRAALFTGGDLEIRPVERFSDEELDWDDPAGADRVGARRAQPGLDLAPARPGGHRADLGRQPGDPALEPGRRPVDPAGRGLRRLRAAAGDLRGDAVGRRGVPDAAQRGRARAARAVPGHPGGHRQGDQPGATAATGGARRYREEQRAAVLRALADYNPAAMVVFGVDFGHTDPQWVLPYGGRITVDGPARRITAHY